MAEQATNLSDEVERLRAEVYRLELLVERKAESASIYKAEVKRLQHGIRELQKVRERCVWQTDRSFSEAIRALDDLPDAVDRVIELLHEE